MAPWRHEMCRRRTRPWPAEDTGVEVVWQTADVSDRRHVDPAAKSSLGRALHRSDKKGNMPIRKRKHIICTCYINIGTYNPFEGL